MSHQNLLEMEDFSHNGSSPTFTRKAPPKPMPRPLPRSRIPKLASSPKKERALDDVISLSSEDGTTGKVSPKQNRRNVAFTATNSFDNDAFVSDEAPGYTAPGTEISSPSHSKPSTSRPQPVQRRKQWNDRTGSSGKSKTFGVNASDSDQANDNIPVIGDYDDEDCDSNATFTIENEKPVVQKPPIPKSKLKDRPNLPRPKQRKSVRMDSTSADEHIQSDSVSPHQTPSTSKRLLKQRSDHSSIEIEPDVETDGKTEANDKAGTDEPDAGSASSVPAATTKSVKSRFGRLFASSSESKNKKSSDNPDNVSSAAELSETSNVTSIGGGGSSGAKEKSSIMNRWKKTFSRSTSKPLQEENEEEEQAEEESVEPEKSKKVKKSKQDTRIFMPESNSEDEDHSAKSELRSEPKASHRHQSRKQSIEKLSADENGNKENDEEAEQQKPKKSKFKPFAKQIIGKNREKSAKSTEKLDDPEPETRSSTRKEKTKAVMGKSEKHRSLSKDAGQFSASSLSEDEDDDLEGSATESVGSRKKSKKEQKESKSKTVSKKKRSTPKRDVIPCVDTTSGKDLLFGVTIHSSDLLPLDPNVIHPVIKVTVMYQNGEYMKRYNAGESGQATEENISRKSERKSRKSKRNRDIDQDLEPTANAVDSVLPIMSQPCQARHSIPTFAPTWNELLVFEEPFKRFATPNKENDMELEPILFFEVMDFLPMSNNGNSVSISGFHGSDPGWYKVAWAFLKPIGANGVFNLNKKLRLQLYKPVKLRSKDRHAGPEVFSWWKSSHREKFNCTLYITAKGILPPETKSASLRQLLSMRKEQLTQAILDSQLATAKNKDRKERQSMYDLRESANWTRMEGQSCKPPNKLVASLPSSQIESLNIVISGNVYTTKFSPCGNMLAAGLDTDELHVILLFKVPSWTLLKSLKGHHGIIYEIVWKIFELDDDNVCHYMASASADSTVRIWSMRNCDEKNLSLMKVLYHPSYVYSVKFHPTHPCLIATGCFDFVIRIWDVKPAHVSDVREGKRKARENTTNKNDASPIILLDQHSSFVNCLLFDATGQHLFSGDGSACILKWSCVSPSKRKSWRLEKDVKLHQGNVPVNCINIHPLGNRLLVHLRDNFLKILDVVTLIPLQTFSGLHNERLQIRSCFSPCGNLVLSGSEDSTLCVWDADTGKILQLTSPQNHPRSIVSCVDYHPFDYYVAIGLASTISEPSPILIYFHNQPKGMNYPMLKKTAMRFRESLEKSRSRQSTLSFDTEDGNVSSRSRVPARRGDSTEKFVRIIQKLDTALYFAQQRNKKRQSEAEQSACASDLQLAGVKSESGTTADAAPPKLENTTFSGSGRHYVKNRSDRPHSASMAAGKKRERFRKSCELRDAKSDSEQISQLGVLDLDTNRNIDNSEPIQVQSKPPKPLKRRSIPHSKDNLENGDSNYS